MFRYIKIYEKYFRKAKRQQCWAFLCRVWTISPCLRGFSPQFKDMQSVGLGHSAPEVGGYIYLCLTYQNIFTKVLLWCLQQRQQHKYQKLLGKGKQTDFRSTTCLGWAPFFSKFRKSHELVVFVNYVNKI